MEVTYELTQKDFTQSFAAHRNRRRGMRWFRRIAFAVMLLVAALAVFGSIRTGNVRAIVPFLVVLAMWAALMSGAVMWLMARQQFLKQPGAHGPRMVTLDHAGAHWSWNGGSSDIEWKNYVRMVEGNNQFLLYTSPACFNIIPKRALGPTQVDEVRSLLQSNITSQT